MAKKRKLVVEEGKEFFIMNKDAKFFMGLYGGDILWTDNMNEAKTFTQESKLTIFNTYHKHEKAQIVYT